MKKILLSTVLGTAISLTFCVSSFAATDSFSNPDLYSSQLLSNISDGLEQSPLKSKEVQLDKEKVKEQIKRADKLNYLSDNELEDAANEAVEAYKKINENDLAAQDWDSWFHLHLAKKAWVFSTQSPVVQKGIPDYVRNRLGYEVKCTFENEQTVKVSVGLEASAEVKGVFTGKISTSAEGTITAKAGQEISVPKESAMKRTAWVRTQTENVAVQYGKYYIGVLGSGGIPQYAGFAYDTYEYDKRNVVAIGKGIDFDPVGLYSY